MDKKTKKELIQVIEEQSKSILKYKTRLHDIIESYKGLQKEKEILQCSIKTLTEVKQRSDGNDEKNEAGATNASSEESISLQKLRSNLGVLTAEKSRIENELLADRKKLLNEKDELEKNICEKENNWFIEKEKLIAQIQEMRKKIGSQQREREKEQHDHVIMLKELQNVLASERASKEKLEDQMSDAQQKVNTKISEKKISDYEKAIEEIQNRLTASQDKARSSEYEIKKIMNLLQSTKEEMAQTKSQCVKKISVEKKRADMAEEKLNLHTLLKEKRIANLENRISELSALVGDHDKSRHQNQVVIEKLKARIAQLQFDGSALPPASAAGTNVWEHTELGSTLDNQDSVIESKDLHTSSHLHCEAEIARLTEEMEEWKSKAESHFQKRYQKTSSALLTDAKAGKQIKELKCKITQLESKLQACTSHLKLNEEYHSRITTSLEKSGEDLKLKHRQELAQFELSHRTQLLELEQQIQKQRERTLALLEEKDKEIGLLKSSFLSSFIQKEKSPQDAEISDNDNRNVVAPDHEAASALISSSLISSKKDGHILHYVQELARKDVEISNLRHSRIQTESALRKLQQSSALAESKYHDEIEALKSRINLLESSQDEKGTNVEYLKNVVLRFLKCKDPSSRRHMINAIATVLHFTNSEVQEVKFL